EARRYPVQFYLRSTTRRRTRLCYAVENKRTVVGWRRADRRDARRPSARTRARSRLARSQRGLRPAVRERRTVPCVRPRLVSRLGHGRRKVYRSRRASTRTVPAQLRTVRAHLRCARAHAQALPVHDLATCRPRRRIWFDQTDGRTLGAPTRRQTRAPVEHIRLGTARCPDPRRHVHGARGTQAWARRMSD